jgi:uncharacterized protein (DUF3084 family)
LTKQRIIAIIEEYQESPPPTGRGKKKMTIDERMDRLTGIVESLAASVVAHDNQIEGLIAVAEKHDTQIAALAEQVANTERQWQAYVMRLPSN